MGQRTAVNDAARARGGTQNALRKILLGGSPLGAFWQAVIQQHEGDREVAPPGRHVEGKVAANVRDHAVCSIGQQQPDAVCVAQRCRDEKGRLPS